MLENKTFGGKVYDFFNFLFISVFSLICVYPLYYCFVASFSDPRQIDAYEGLIVYPLGFTTKSYELVFKNPFIIKGLLYTVFLVVVGTSVNILFTSFGAYVLSRKNLYWKKPMTLMIIFTMYFSGGLIPFYLVVAQLLNLQNTPWAIILPGAINTFNLIVMRTYFIGIPDSMEESAKIDGANDFTILFRIILPLSLPVIAVMVIYYGVAQWNGWFYAMIFLTKNNNGWRPLQLTLRDVLITNSTQTMMDLESSVEAEQSRRIVKYALIVITTFPIIVIYPFMQKHFVGGLMIGSVKG